MNKVQGFYNFFSSFGVPAWEENSLPTGENAPEFPYITYQVVTSSHIQSAIFTASLWDRSTSWARLENLLEQIKGRVGYYLPLKCDEGTIVLRFGNPEAQNMGDTSDNLIKRKLLNFSADYITD